MTTGRSLLRLLFKFDRWHISSYAQREYAQKIVAHLNSRTAKNSVIEIGCGLGDILRRLSFSNKVGLDCEREVLRAASLVSKVSNPGGGRLTYHCFTFPNDKLEGRFDAIVMVNWLHHIEPSILEVHIRNVFSHHLEAGGELVFDVVSNPAYRYNHDWKQLTQNMVAQILLYGPFEYGRTIVVAKKGSK